MSLKILVIGGSGFIGTRLLERLKVSGNKVTNFDLEAPVAVDTHHVYGDIRDLNAVCEAAAGQDVIYNLAAQHRDDVRPLSLYEEVNVFGSRNVCTAAERAGVKRLIFTSSVAVYGNGSSALREDDPHNWINEYGRTKSLAEIELRNWRDRSAENRLIVVRPTVIFGPGNRGNVHNLLKQISSGHFFMVGNGTNHKSMAYVDNIADFLAHTLSLSGDMQVYNYADRPDFDMNTLVSLVRSEFGRGQGVGPRLPAAMALAAGYLADGIAWITGRNLPISSVRVRKFQANTAIDASKAFGTGFQPRTTLSEGLKQTLRADFGC